MPSISPFDKGAFTGLNSLDRLRQLANGLRDLLALPPQHWGATMHHQTSSFGHGSRDQIEVLVLSRQIPVPSSHLHSPHISS